MATCEKCWRDSGGDVDQYAYLVNKNECTPEEQAGEDAVMCPKCNRFTMHQHCHFCVICGNR